MMAFTKCLSDKANATEYASPEEMLVDCRACCAECAVPGDYCPFIQESTGQTCQQRCQAMADESAPR